VKKLGAHTTLTKEKIQMAKELAEIGLKRNKIREALGYAPSTWSEMLKDGELLAHGEEPVKYKSEESKALIQELYETITQTEIELQKELILGLRRLAKNDTRHTTRIITWLLENRFPEEWNERYIISKLQAEMVKQIEEEKRAEKGDALDKLIGRIDYVVNRSKEEHKEDE
jgi:formate dehydrogenase maturation protein FdhE